MDRRGVMRLPDRAGYQRVRTPHVSETAAAQLITNTTHLRQEPHANNAFVEIQAAEGAA
jgi:hypothetical protein